MQVSYHSHSRSGRRARHGGRHTVSFLALMVCAAALMLWGGTEATSPKAVQTSLLRKPKMICQLEPRPIPCSTSPPQIPHRHWQRRSFQSRS